MLSICKPTFALAAVFLASVATPALAASEPSTRLVRCDAGNCLLVSGYRNNATSEVRINGQAVTVEGNRHWQAILPVQTVRDWSEPWARSIDVTTYGSGMRDISSEKADLPIGLMGHTDLASLVVAVH